MLTPWVPLFGFACCVLAAATLGALLFARRARQALGTTLCRAGRGRTVRVAVLALVAASGLGLARSAGQLPWPVAAALCLAVAGTLVRPGGDEEACGTEGVRRGWTVRSFAALEEWRLVGEHLRFRVGGRWLAVRLPREHQGATRERLQALAPGRESPLG